MCCLRDGRFWLGGRSVILDRPPVNQLGLARRDYMTPKRKPHDAGSTHAGGIVYRLKDATLELLLVSSRYVRSSPS